MELQNLKNFYDVLPIARTRKELDQRRRLEMAFVVLKNFEDKIKSGKFGKRSKGVS